MKNAKSDDERMELAMQYAQQMQETMTQGGGPEGIPGKTCHKHPNAKYDPIKMPNAEASTRTSSIMIFLCLPMIKDI